MNLIHDKLDNINLNDYDILVCNDCYGGISINLRKKISSLEKERLKFRESINIDDNYSFFVGIIVETVYKKPTGEVIHKQTNHRPWNYKNHNKYDYDNTFLKPGMKNSYGHLVLDSYEQYYFKF